MRGQAIEAFYAVEGYLDLRENEPLDEAQMTPWLRQWSAWPGWIP